MRFLAFLVLACFVVTPVKAQMEAIAAVVNQDAISMSDVEDRMELIIAASGLPNTPEVHNKLLGQVLSSLIEEQLKLQEAQRLGLEVSQEEIDEGFAAIAAQNNVPPEQFSAMLQKGGINLVTMEKQIRSQISWTKVIQSQMRPKVVVTDKDIDDMLARRKQKEGTMQYHVAEIFLPVDASQNEGDTLQLADKLVNEIRNNKAPFSKVAQQFSKAAGSAQGGDMGWIQQGQLPQELDRELAMMQKGEISDPVRSLSGYHILFLRDARQISSENEPSRDDVMSTIGVQRLDRMQRRYLMDLKSAAFIENRVRS